MLNGVVAWKSLGDWRSFGSYYKGYLDGRYYWSEAGEWKWCEYKDNKKQHDSKEFTCNPNIKEFEKVLETAEKWKTSWNFDE